jgi:hypothetical protein
MRSLNTLFVFIFIVVAAGLTCTEKRNPKSAFNSLYESENLNRIAFSVGGMGSGMFCPDEIGSVSNMSVRPQPAVFNEP